MSNTLSLSDLDIAFADMLMRVQPSHMDAWCLAALTSHAYQQGHACLVLDNQLTDIVLINTDGFIKGQLSPQWRLQQAMCTWWQGETNTPLVWIANRLYLHRAWQDEVTIRRSKRRKIG